MQIITADSICKAIEFNQDLLGIEKSWELIEEVRKTEEEMPSSLGYTMDKMKCDLCGFEGMSIHPVPIILPAECPGCRRMGLSKITGLEDFFDIV